MVTRVCARCKKEKSEESFAWRYKREKVRLQHCRACQKEYSARWYAQNKQRHLKNVRKYQKEYLALVHGKIREIFRTHPCKCGQSHPAALDFHHVRGVKSRAVSTMISANEPWSRIHAEIQKCDVICSNCHRIHTAKTYGWYKHMLPSSNG